VEDYGNEDQAVSVCKERDFVPGQMESDTKFMVCYRACWFEQERRKQRCSFSHCK